jgi:hypothetical protein
MSRSIELHVGDVGTEIVISLVDGTTPVDLTALTSAVIKVQRPDRTSVDIAASVLGAVADGKLVGVVPSGTFTTRGNYSFQAYLIMGAQIMHSQSVKVRVSEVVPNTQ